MRINDTHDSWGYEWADLITSSIKKQHPEWLVASKEKRSKVGGFLAADFTHLEIRDYTFRFVEEVCQNYDVDGVYLFNAFNPGHPLWRELGDPATLARRTKVYTTGGRGVDAVPRWLVGGERFLNRDPVSPRRPRKLAAGEPTVVELRIGEEPAETGAEVALSLRLEGSSPGEPAVLVNGETPGTPVQKGVWLEYPVPALLARQGINQISFTAKGGDVVLRDIAVWARQKHARTD
jgi:hypothetical protein